MSKKNKHTFSNRNLCLNLIHDLGKYILTESV